MANHNWVNQTLQFLCKGIEEQRGKHHVQPSGCLFLLVVLYLEHVSPIVKPSIRKFPSLVLWGDAKMKTVLHQFDKIGGYDSEGVVVHFTEVVEGSGNEGGVSHISTADVQTMTNTFVTVAVVAAKYVHAKLIGFEIQCNPQVEMAQGMDVNNVQLMEQVATLLKGLRSCQSSPPTMFETPEHVMKESKGLSTNPSVGRHIGFETPSQSKLEQEMAQEIDMDPFHPFAKASPQVTARNVTETPTPTLFTTPQLDGQKSNGLDTRTASKSRIQVDMDEDVCSPSPVKGFRSLGGLSRGRKRKLQIGKLVPFVGPSDNVDVHYEPLRLRQVDKLKKSHFQQSPFTKDGVKKRNPPKKQPVDVEFPTFRGRYTSKKGLDFVGVQQLYPTTMAYIEEMTDVAMNTTYEPLTEHEKLFTEFIFDIRDQSNG